MNIFYILFIFKNRVIDTYCAAKVWQRNNKKFLTYDGLHCDNLSNALKLNVENEARDYFHFGFKIGEGTQFLVTSESQNIYKKFFCFNLIK